THARRRCPPQSPVPGFGEKYWSLSGFLSHSLESGGGETSVLQIAVVGRFRRGVRGSGLVYLFLGPSPRRSILGRDQTRRRPRSASSFRVKGAFFACPLCALASCGLKVRKPQILQGTFPSVRELLLPISLTLPFRTTR